MSQEQLDIASLTKWLDALEGATAKRLDTLEAATAKRFDTLEAAAAAAAKASADQSAKIDSMAKASADQNVKIDSMATTLIELGRTRVSTDGKLDQLISAMNKGEQWKAASTVAAAHGAVPPAPLDMTRISALGTRFDPGTLPDKPPSGQKTPGVEDDEDGYATASSEKSSRTKKKTKKKPKRASSDSGSETEDEDLLNATGYVYDQPSIIIPGEDTTRRGTTKREPTTLNVKEFDFGNETADWTSWVKKFQGTVKGACDPRSEAEHHKLNLRWLPPYLNTAAHDIFLNCRHKNNWKKVVLELEEAFDDPGIRQRWATDLKAYTWDQKIPLHVYKSNVIRFVNKFETEIRHAPAARKKAYFTRFVGGLPDEYINFIEQQLYGSKQTVDHALKVSQQFKIIKDRTAGAKKEVAGALNFQGNYGNERVLALEQEVAKLKTQAQGSGYKSDNNDRSRTRDAGHTPHTKSISFDRSPHRNRSGNRDNRNHSGNRDNRYQSNNRGSDRSGGNRQFSSTQDRLQRYKDSRNYQNGRNSNPRHGDDLNKRLADHFKNKPGSSQSNRGGDSHRRRQDDSQTTPDQSCALDEEVESPAEELDVTAAAFVSWREANEADEFEAYKAAQDAAKGIPGN